MIKYAIIGCGDVGRRVAIELMREGTRHDEIVAIVRSEASVLVAGALGLQVNQMDFDAPITAFPKALNGAKWCYLVPPQKSGKQDLRGQNFLMGATNAHIKPSRVALISTTGVYGDAEGEWVDEHSPTLPQTERAVRRLDLEKNWRAWCAEQRSILRVLRVPGIYSNSRIPRARLAAGTPVVRSAECGYSNRIHADDLSGAIIAAMHYIGSEVVFNITDGSPSTITEYLQTAAQVVGLPPLDEISMEDATNQLSSGMLSYLSESRRISNQRMRDELAITLRYPDFREGLLY